MTKLLDALVGLILLVTLSQSVATAQEPPPSRFSLTFGTRLWASSGFSEDSTSALGISPLSELRWRDADALIPEVFVDLVWKRLVVRGAVGRSDITDGEFIDEDFLFSNRQGRFSVTKSEVAGDHVFYAQGDIGVRVLRWTSGGRLGYVDVLGGYQYWREKYEAFGLTGAQGLPANLVPIVPISTSVKVITHDYVWQNVRLGGRWEVPTSRRIGFRAEMFFVPWSTFEQVDVHHLRTDLRQDPSFLSNATGGFGFEFEGALSYTIWAGLAVEGGFRYWKVKSGDGDTEVRTLTQGTSTIKFDGAETERYGPFVGLRYRF